MSSVPSGVARAVAHSSAVVARAPAGAAALVTTVVARARAGVAVALVAAVVALSLPSVAVARGGSDDGEGHGGGDDQRARTTARCGYAASTRLDLRARDGAIEVRFALEHARAGETWRLVLVQEDRVAWRGSARTGRSGALEARPRLRDLPGVDRVSVRASGPRGTVCRVAVALRG